MAKSITSASVPGNLAILKLLSKKSYIPFSTQVCGGLVLYFSLTSSAKIYYPRQLTSLSRYRRQFSFHIFSLTQSSAKSTACFSYFNN
jgi:hypothetical protein